MKNMTVKSMDNLNITWTTDKRTGSKPLIKKGSNAANGSGFRGMCVNYVGVLPLDLGVLPTGLYVAQIKSVQYGVVAAFKLVRE